MKEKLKRKFTLWCSKKKYVQFDDVGLIKLVCPIWVRILAVKLFSPSIYWENFTRGLATAFDIGLRNGLKTANEAIRNLANTISEAVRDHEPNL